MPSASPLFVKACPNMYMAAISTTADDEKPSKPSSSTSRTPVSTSATTTARAVTSNRTASVTKRIRLPRQDRQDDGLVVEIGHDVTTEAPAFLQVLGVEMTPPDSRREARAEPGQRSPRRACASLL